MWNSQFNIITSKQSMNVPLTCNADPVTEYWKPINYGGRKSFEVTS